MSTLKKYQIVARFVLSCGNSSGPEMNNDNIFCAFNGMGTEIVIASRKGNTFCDEITLEQLFEKIKTYIVEKTTNIPTLQEKINDLFLLIHFHEKITQEFIEEVFLQNFEGHIPTYYLCDHCHDDILVGRRI